MEHPGLVQVLILLAASVVAVTLLRRLHLPPVLGYLAVGLGVGPHALDLIPQTADTRLLAEFGVVFLLFTLGLEFSASRLMAMRHLVFMLGGVQVAFSVVIVGGGLWLLGILEPGPAVVLGGAIAMSSTAIVARQLSEQLEIHQSHGHRAIGILLFQDLAIVPFLILIPALAGSADQSLWTTLGWALVKAAVALTVVLLGGRYALRHVLYQAAHARSSELFTLTVLLVVLASATATHMLGLSLVLGAFLAGMMLAETEFRHQVAADIRPFRDVLLGLFFVTVGMLLDLDVLARAWPIVLLGVMALIIGKGVLITLLARAADADWHSAVRTGVTLAQGGEFGAALLTLALPAAVLPTEAGQQALAILILSMVISPLLIRANGRIARGIFPDPEDQEKADMAEEMRVGSLPSVEHVIIIGYGRIGQNLARFLEREGFEFIALDLDPYRVRAAREAGDPVHYGDATHMDVLNAAGLGHAKAMVIAFHDVPATLKILRNVRAVNLDIPILVRTLDDTDLDRLQAAGATEVVPELLESSLMLVSHLLALLHVPMSRIVRTVRDVRSHRYSLLRTLFRAEDARPLDPSHAFREQLNNITVVPEAWAVGRRIEELGLPDHHLVVTALRRHGIVGRQPADDTLLQEGDVLVLYGTPEDLEQGEARILHGPRN